MKTILLFTILLINTSSVFSKPINVKAYYNNNIVEISWLNPEHSDIEFFVIERSKHGRYFDEVLKINGARKNKLGYIEYFEIDSKPFKRKGYYRIKSISTTGKTYYSEMVFTENNKSSNFALNLFNLKTKSKVKGFSANDVILVLVDSLKNEIIAKVDIVEENNKLIITRTDTFLPTGEYLISGTSEDVIYGATITVNGMYAKSY